MKISVSLSADDVPTLDEYARSTGLSSRSAAVHAAVRSLRLPELEDDYAAAWDEWEVSGEHDDLDTAVADGLADEAR